MLRCVLRSGWLVALWCCSALGQDVPPLSASYAGGFDGRPFAAICTDARTALRDETTARRTPRHADAVRRLVDLYNEAMDHPRFAHSPVLQRTRIRLRNRLMAIHRQMASSARTATGLRPASISAVGGALFQQPVASGLAFPPPGGGAALGGTAADYGIELVELIERTISRDTWQVNGGRASIVYYRPWQALVISAPSEVHDRVAVLLGDLRAAGGR